ncbi:MAG: apolipoprotein N-acyltransferase [Chthoniobacterales bacterium]|nr:apolipoprotein N-acyltransferase [Chthoniobacterales bacterium]
MNVAKKALRLWPWLAAITSGVLYRACFAPYNQAWLCWIALTPLLAAVWFSESEPGRRRWLRDLLLGYVAGAVFFWGVFSWLHTVTVPGVVLVGLYMAIYMAVWAWLCGRLRPRARTPKAAEGLEAVTQRLAAKRGMSPVPGADPVQVRSPWLSSLNNLRLALLLASAWVTVETLRGVVFSGWGWNTLGHALHDQWALIQIVEFTGVPGLSFVVAFTNVILAATVARFVLEAKARKSRPHFDFTITMAAIVGLIGFGIRAVQTKQPSVKVRVAALQPNIPREEKFNPQFVQATFDKFTQLSQLALQSQPDLLIWPESSMPEPVLPGGASYDFVTSFSAKAKTDLLLGVIDEDEKDVYNAAMLVSDGGKLMQLYRKMHLVPFGEYVPGRHTIPGIGAIVGDQVPEDFGFGTKHTVFQLTRLDVRVAPLICFEDTIGELTRQFVLAGANLLANVTNDGWFQRSAGSQQHLANAVFRCVETRLPMVRSANTGVTCFINEYGRVTEVLLDEHGSQFTEGFKSAEVLVPQVYEPTFYVRHGEIFAELCAVITSATLAVLVLRSLTHRTA